jgi:hypothetical protein
MPLQGIIEILTTTECLMRQFRDAAGVDWQVYQTDRSASAERGRDHLLPAEYREGWLVFESATEKRRLAPVPPGWSDLSDEALAGLCASATPPTRGPRRRDKEAAPQGAAELHAVEERLNKTLEEVCDAPDAEKLDTGELMRVEKKLAVATQAAKEAVSLRRQRRSQLSQGEQREQERHD